MRQPIEALGLLDELLAIITRHCGGDSLELVPALHAKAEVLEELDKLAKKDVKRIQELFEETDLEGTIDIDEDNFDTIDDVVVFK